ncbi:MAG: ATP-binding protein, partial [Clostridia bacterium]|nr:ATP-binding protein [Clostridia bacterium]
MGNRILKNTFYSLVGAYVLSSLTSVIGSLVDGVIIGQFLGVDSLAAFGLIAPIEVVLVLIGAVLASGARTRFLHLIGKGQVKEAQGVFSLAVTLAVGAAVIMMAAMLVFSTPLTKLLGASGNAADLLPGARAYLIGVTLGLPARNAMWILWPFMTIDNDRKLPLIASIVMTAADIILDLIVVLVLHGNTFEMGLATSLSYCAALTVFMMHFRKKDILLRFSFRSLPWKETGRMLTHGMPAGFFRLGNTLRGTVMNRLLAFAASSAAIAAYSVYRQAGSFFNPLCLGIADAVAMLAGVLSGEEDRPMTRRLISTSARTTLILTAGVAASGFAAAPLFASLFVKNDPEALALSARAVRFYMLGMPLYGLNLIYINYLQGIGRSRLSSVCSFLVQVVLPVLCSLALLPRFGADAVFFAQPIAQLIMLVIFCVIVAVETKKLGICRKGLLNRILLQPDSFDVSEENCLDASISSMDEVAALSRSVWDFCETHGCDGRRKYLMSLAVEEMAGNVIEHGFTKDRKHHSIDVRILKKDDEYILRIRDDCIIFDPVKQLELYSDDEPAHHMGLR